MNDSTAGGGLRGQDIVESQLGKVPDANDLDGLDSTAFLRNNTYKNESTVGAGTALGDNTHSMEASCLPGDTLLSGGPANIAANTTLLESFPAPGAPSRGRSGSTARPDRQLLGRRALREPVIARAGAGPRASVLRPAPSPARIRSSCATLRGHDALRRAVCARPFDI